MHHSIFKLARAGQLIVAAENGVRILGRTYSKGDVVRYRVNLNRAYLKKLLKRGDLAIKGEEVSEEIETTDPDLIPLTDVTDESEELLNNEDDAEVEGVEDTIAIIEEAVDILEGDDEEPEDGCEEELEGSEIEIEEDLQVEETTDSEVTVGIPSREELNEMDLVAIRLIAEPLGLKSNSKEKLIEKLLAH